MLRARHRCPNGAAGRRRRNDRADVLPRDRLPSRHHQRPRHVRGFARCSSERHRLRAGDLRERGQALPGAAAALASLESLASLEDFVQAVVTGNIRAVAKTKLAVFGLATYSRFPYGGYGEDHDGRADLVRRAMARTTGTLGRTVDSADVLLIGDTSADSATARAAGVPSWVSPPAGRPSTASPRPEPPKPSRTSSTSTYCAECSPDPTTPSRQHPPRSALGPVRHHGGRGTGPSDPRTACSLWTEPWCPSAITLSPSGR
ncbi:haloacid dehalogenase-like hydrolase [Streptomyces atratus]|nr:haloacid dehalogenase-like hydrolase [Streptomyces atratus]